MGPSITTTISFAGKVCDNKLSKQVANSLAFVPKYTDTKTEKFIGWKFGDIPVPFCDMLISVETMTLKSDYLS